MSSSQRKARSHNSFSHSIIRDIDKALLSTSSTTDKNNSTKNKSNNKKNTDFAITKKVVETIKVEEKCQKNNEETSKKDDISNNISHKKQSVKWNPNIIEINDSVKNFNTKHELKEIDTDTLDNVQIVKDKIVKKEKIAIIKSANAELLDMSKRKSDEVQSKTFLNLTVFKKSKRGGVSYYLQDISSTGKCNELPKITKNKKNVRKKKNVKQKTSKNNTTAVNIKVETFNKYTSVIVGDRLLVYYNQNELYEAKILKIHNIDGVMKYYIHYTGWNIRYDEWIDILRIGFKILGLIQESEGHSNIDSSKINLLENSEKLKIVIEKKENERKTSNNINPFINIKDEPCDEDTSETVEDNLAEYNGDNQAITHDVKNNENNKKIKTVRKKRENKETTTNNINTFINLKDEPCDEDTSMTVEYNLSVYYGNHQAIPFDTKNTENNELLKTDRKKKEHKEPTTNNINTFINIKDEPCDEDTSETVEDNLAEYNGDNQAITHDVKQTNLDSKKILSTTSRIKRSIVIPNKSYSLRKKTPYSRTRPTRACTLSKFYFDNSDSETEYSERPVRSFKQYSKKKTIKTKPDVVKAESLETNNQKKNMCLKTNPSKNVFMRRNLSSKPKSSGFKIYDNKSEEVEICKQNTLKPSFDLNVMIPSQSYNIKSNADNEDVEVQNKSKISDGAIFKPKITLNHYLSPKKRAIKNLEKMSESSNNQSEEVRINAKQLTMTKKSEIFNTIYHSSSSEVEEQNEFKKVTEVISPPLDNKFDKSRISDPDFYSNKIRLDMKEPMLISRNSNNDIIKETNILNQQLKIDVSKSNEPITDVNKFKESESCNFDDISSDIDSSKLLNSEKLDELPRVINSSAQVEVIDNNKSIIPIVPIIYSKDSFDNNIGIKVNENLKNLNEIHDSIAQNKSDVYDNKNQILDLKSSEPSSNNICIIQNELIYCGIKKDINDFDDDDDDDNFRLVIVEEPNYESDGNIQAQSLPSLPSNIHPNELEFKSLYPIKKNNTSPVDIDDENIQNDFISNFNISSYSKSYNYEVDKSTVLPELQSREKLVDGNSLNNTLVMKNNHYDAEYDIYKPSTSKSLCDSISQPNTSKDGCYETNTSSDAKYEFFVAKQAVNNVTFDTNVPYKSNLLNHNIPSTSKYNFYENSMPSTSKYNSYENPMPSTSKYNFYENSMPSTSKQMYNPEADVNSTLYEETIPDNSTSTSVEQCKQDVTTEIFGKSNFDEIEAVLGMCAMSQPYHMTNAIEIQIKEDTNIHQNENQRRLKNCVTNTNEPLVTEIVKLPEKSLFKHNTSNSPKRQTKRRKSSTTIAHISTGNQF